MGSIKRKINRRKQLKKRKQAQKKVNKIGEQVSSMPSTCDVCNVSFDSTDKSMLNQWRIAVWDDGRIELTCPDCGPTPEELDAYSENM